MEQPIQGMLFAVQAENWKAREQASQASDWKEHTAIAADRHRPVESVARPDDGQWAVLQLAGITANSGDV